MTDYVLMPEEATPEMEQAAEKYWNDRKFKTLSDDPRTWKGLYEAMRAAAPNMQGEPVAPNPEFDIFCNAFAQYVADLEAHHRWLVWPNAGESGDRGEAWRDFRGTGDTFEYLCDMAGVDSDVVRTAIKAHLVAICEGGIQ